MGRFDALEVLGTVCWWEGDLDEVERLATERLAIAERIGRPDLQSGVLLELNDVYNARLEPERAQEPLARAIELAGESGSPTTRGWILRAIGRQAALEGRLAEAEVSLEQARALFAESGAALTLGRTLNWLGLVVWERARPSTRGGDPSRGDPRPEADRGPGHARREPAPARPGAARRRGGSTTRSGSRSRRARRSAPRTCPPSSTTRLALGLVRAAQGRDDEAEQLAPRGRRDPAADRFPPPPDRSARGARRRSSARAAARTRRGRSRTRSARSSASPPRRSAT